MHTYDYNTSQCISLSHAAQLPLLTHHEILDGILDPRIDEEQLLRGDGEVDAVVPLRLGLGVLEQLSREEFEHDRYYVSA